MFCDDVTRSRYNLGVLQFGLQSLHLGFWGRENAETVSTSETKELTKCFEGFLPKEFRFLHKLSMDESPGIPFKIAQFSLKTTKRK